MISNYKKVQGPVCKDLPDDEKRRIVNDLMKAFPNTSFEDAVSAYMEDKRNSDAASNVLTSQIYYKEDLADSSSSSRSLVDSIWGSGSSGEAEFVEIGICGKNIGGRKTKRVVAATGTISTILKKDYMMYGRRGDFLKQKDYCNKLLNRGDMEQFLCSMLGNESELNMGIVRDVLCHCEYDIVKSLDALLDFCAPSNELSKNGSYSSHIAVNKEDAELQSDCNLGILDVESDFTSHSFKSESWDNEPPMAYGYRSYSEVLTGSEGTFVGDPRDSNSDPSQEMLQSLFNIPSFYEHESNTLNWRDFVKKVKLMSHGVNFSSTESCLNAKGDEYDMLRRDAKKNWDSMRGCYKRAASVYSNGDRNSASYHSEQGISHRRRAREADEKASRDIFRARNKRIQNEITIDLHGQNVKEAINMLKLHLFFGTYLQSIQSIRVITGCGAPGAGKSRLKEAVIELVEREGIEWSSGENPGCVLIKVDGQRELKFLHRE